MFLTYRAVTNSEDTIDSLRNRESLQDESRPSVDWVWKKHTDRCTVFPEACFQVFLFLTDSHSVASTQKVQCVWKRLKGQCLRRSKQLLRVLRAANASLSVDAGPRRKWMADHIAEWTRNGHLTVDTVDVSTITAMRLSEGDSGGGLNTTLGRGRKGGGGNEGGFILTHFSSLTGSCRQLCKLLSLPEKQSGIHGVLPWCWSTGPTPQRGKTCCWIISKYINWFTYQLLASHLRGSPYQRRLLCLVIILTSLLYLTPADTTRRSE